MPQLGHTRPIACPQASQEVASGGLTRPQAGHSIDAKPLFSFDRLYGFFGRTNRADRDLRYALHHNVASMSRFLGTPGTEGDLVLVPQGRETVGWVGQSNLTVLSSVERCPVWYTFVGPLTTQRPLPKTCTSVSIDLRKPMGDANLDADVGARPPQGCKRKA